MLIRVWQLVSALTAKINNNDKQFVKAFLTNAEQRLFWGMNIPDQRHSLNVAYSCIEIAKKSSDIDSTILVTSALLHDVGKQFGDVSTLDKIITVLAHKIMPSWAKCWGREGRGSTVQNLRHAFYVYFYHPHRSAELLRGIGTNSAVIDIVARHHENASSLDRPELTVLKIADAMH